ncbi:MAG: dCTP deaminase domain-containing protein [Bacillota bacterium]
MSFLALEKDSITEDEGKFFSGEAKIFFSPLPSSKDNEFPTVWVDLHLSGDGYEICGKDKKLKFEKSNGDFFVSIRPGCSLRFITLEKVGVKNNITGIVVNSAGIAVRGLSVAPGKVDPGFSPNRLTLVVTNQSKKSIDLKAGDKIASVGFIQTSGQCAPSKSPGWALRKIEGYSKSNFDKFKERIRNLDAFELVKSLLMAAAGAAIVLFVQYFLGKAGIQ